MGWVVVVVGHSCWTAGGVGLGCWRPGGVGLFQSRAGWLKGKRGPVGDVRDSSDRRFCESWNHLFSSVAQPFNK